MLSESSPLRSRRKLRPKHVLINYLALMTEPQSDFEIQSSLDEIASGLAPHFETFRDPAVRTELVDEFGAWREHKLIALDHDTNRWTVSPEMSENFRVIAEGFNRDLDPEEVADMQHVIRSVKPRHSAEGASL